MNTKLLSLFTALGLITNAAVFGSSASIGYVSDFFYRGEQKALESVQSQVGHETSFLGLDATFNVLTNQSIDEGSDSYSFGGGLGKSFSNGLLSVYGGFNHYEDVPGDALAEGFVRAASNIVLNPTVTIYRDIDKALFTYEGSLSQDIDLQLASLNLNGSVGNTEVTTSDARTYYSVGAGLSRPLGEAEAGLSIDLINSDEIEREFVFGAAISFKF
jgi:hypothetical protein